MTEAAAGVPHGRSKEPNSRDAHHLYSSLREKVVEHVFVGEVLRALWRRGIFDAEVLRSEFDAYGYDLVMGREKSSATYNSKPD